MLLIWFEIFGCFYNLKFKCVICSINPFLDFSGKSSSISVCDSCILTRAYMTESPQLCSASKWEHDIGGKSTSATWATQIVTAQM